MAEKTIFEKIVSGELPSKKVLENDKFLAFYDISPKAPVHILAIPKECVKDFDCADFSSSRGALWLCSRGCKKSGD